MEKELKISELALLWGVSVPAAWNRVRREELKTVKKLSENKKEITYVLISDDILNKYIINPVNNVNNVLNNNYNEELLTNNNLVNNVNNDEKPENTLNAKEIFERLTILNNNHNEELKTVNNELIKANIELAEVKSKQLLLEDKASREGLYLNEINTLKKDNNKLSNINKLLIIVIVLLLTVIIIATTYFITVNYISKNVHDESKTVIENVENK